MSDHLGYYGLTDEDPTNNINAGFLMPVEEDNFICPNSLNQAQEFLSNGKNLHQNNYSSGFINENVRSTGITGDIAHELNADQNYEKTFNCQQNHTPDEFVSDFPYDLSIGFGNTETNSITKQQNIFPDTLILKQKEDIDNVDMNNSEDLNEMKEVLLEKDDRTNSNIVWEPISKEFVDNYMRKTLNDLSDANDLSSFSNTEKSVGKSSNTAKSTDQNQRSTGTTDVNANNNQGANAESELIDEQTLNYQRKLNNFVPGHQLLLLMQIFFELAELKLYNSGKCMHRNDYMLKSILSTFIQVFILSTVNKIALNIGKFEKLTYKVMIADLTTARIILKKSIYEVFGKLSYNENNKNLMEKLYNQANPIIKTILKIPLSYIYTNIFLHSTFYVDLLKKVKEQKGAEYYGDYEINCKNLISNLIKTEANKSKEKEKLKNLISKYKNVEEAEDEYVLECHKENSIKKKYIFIKVI